MDNWVLAAVPAIPAEGTVQQVKAGGRSIIIVNVAGELFSLLNECPHLGCTMHRGRLDGYLLMCPCHDWVFDIRSGAFTAAPEITIPVYPVKLENGEIYVNLGGES